MNTDSFSNDTNEQLFWHGGSPGIALGKRVRPASGLPKPFGYLNPGSSADPSRVYVTTDMKFARSFAAKWVSITNFAEFGHGTLYRVRPIGGLEIDPDFDQTDGLSYTCQIAVVEEIVETEVAATFDLELYQMSFSTWEPGAPLYDKDGYMLPHPLLLKHGITAKSLRVLGRLPTFVELDQLVLRKLGYYPKPEHPKS